MASLAAALVLTSCADSASNDLVETNELSQEFTNHYLGNAPIHEQITIDTLSELRPEVRNYLAHANAKVDIVSLFNANYAHFDGCAFQQSSEAIRTRYSEAVDAVIQFPTRFVGCDTGFENCSARPRGSAAALDAFGAILHAVQDFYSHTNWVENGKAEIVDASLGEFPLLTPYSSLAGLLLVDGSGADVISARRRTSYPESLLVGVLAGESAPLPGLISGSTAYDATSCPQFSGGVRLISHATLNKDGADTHPESHLVARHLAEKQTRQEWCRLVNLVHASHGQAGIDALCSQWLTTPEALRNGCPDLPEAVQCAGGE